MIFDMHDDVSRILLQMIMTAMMMIFTMMYVPEILTDDEHDNSCSRCLDALVTSQARVTTCCMSLASNAILSRSPSGNHSCARSTSKSVGLRIALCLPYFITT